MTPILSILIATIASIVLGYFWYGPLFGDRWLQLSGIKKKNHEKNDMSAAFAVMIVSTIITAAVLASIIKWTKMVSAEGGAQIGFFAGFGFVMTTMATLYIFSGKSRSLYLIDATFPLVSLTLMGMILGATL